MLKITVTVALAVLVAAILPQAALAADKNVVYLGTIAPFSDSSVVSMAIINECNLPARQSEFIEQAALDDGTLRVVRDDAAVKAGKGRILFVEIVNAISGGSAWVGHRKQVAIKGRLVENGVVIGTFSGIRQSGGGAWGEYKSSCAVLGRCIKTLGNDVVRWLKNPQMNSRIGE